MADVVSTKIPFFGCVNYTKSMRKQRTHLIDLAAEGKQRAWWQTRSLTYSDYIGLEKEAASISDFGLALVPGLLQTAEYARSILRAGVPALAPRIVEKRVQARIARQRLLFPPAPLVFETVLDESVLHRVVEGPSVMLAQLTRLLELSQLPNITIRVLPYDAGIVPAGVNKFVILRSVKPDIPDLVHIEELIHDRDLMEPREVERYIATFLKLTDMSADADASETMIRAEMARYESRLR